MSQGKILVELQESMGSDESIANAAWTSTYDKNKREDKYDDSEKVSKIVRQLILDGHGTPIESVILRFWIRMPIFADRQHITHRIASHNGLSGRYRTMPEDFFSLPDDVVGIFNKSAPMWPGQEFGLEIKEEYDQMCNLATELYKTQLSNLKSAEKLGHITNKELKRAREVIRGVLPTAGMIERTTIMNLRSFANYQYQRNSDHAQPEIRQVALLMLAAVKDANIAPTAIATLEELGWDV
jgi:thymidylate synthase (FAD)